MTTYYAQTVTRAARNRDDSEALEQVLDLGTDIGLSRTEIYVDVAAEEVAIAADHAARRAGLVHMLREQYRWAIRNGGRGTVFAEFLFYDTYGFQRYDNDAPELWSSFVTRLRAETEKELRDHYGFQFSSLPAHDC